MTEEDTFLALKKWSFDELMLSWSDGRISLIEFRSDILKKAGWTWEEFASHHNSRHRYV